MVEPKRAGAGVGLSGKLAAGGGVEIGVGTKGFIFLGSSSLSEPTRHISCSVGTFCSSEDAS